MNDKQRAEFEKWAKGGYILDRSSSGNYVSVITNLAWSTWQAAIASVVVELPSSRKFISVKELKEKINKAGINYE